MNLAAEQCLRDVILPQLEMGRPNYDRPHTELVVVYAKEILAASAHLGLDEDVLTIAAYAHDWGYAGLFDHGLPVGRHDVRSAKNDHMELGARKIAALLGEPVFGYLGPERRDRARHLVHVHDDVEWLSDVDELVLMEADTLAVFDSRAPSTFSEEDKRRVRENARHRRLTRFLTDYSKAKIRELEELAP